VQIDTPKERGFVIECVCGEKLVVLGREEEWRSRNPIFRCECGENLTLSAKNVGQEEFLDAG
jgi:hypothetical protein